MEFAVVNAFAGRQVALSASAVAVAQVFNLTAAAAITTVALQAIAAVAIASLALDLVDGITGWELKKYVPFMFETQYSIVEAQGEYFDGGEGTPVRDDNATAFRALKLMVLVSTVGLFALSFVAAPVAQFGMLCFLGSEASKIGYEKVSEGVSSLKEKVFPKRGGGAERGSVMAARMEAPYSSAAQQHHLSFGQRGTGDFYTPADGGTSD